MVYGPPTLIPFNRYKPFVSAVVPYCVAVGMWIAMIDAPASGVPSAAVILPEIADVVVWAKANAGSATDARRVKRYFFI